MPDKSSQIPVRSSIAHADSKRVSTRKKIKGKKTTTYRHCRGGIHPNQTEYLNDSERTFRIPKRKDYANFNKFTLSRRQKCARSDRKQNETIWPTTWPNAVEVTDVEVNRGDSNRQSTVHLLKAKSSNNHFLWSRHHLGRPPIFPKIACPTLFTDETCHASGSDRLNILRHTAQTRAHQAVEYSTPRFVNIVNRSWLLATVKERCFWDHVVKQTVVEQSNKKFFHRNCFDIIFSMCSRCNQNLQERPSLSSNTHCRNVLNRLRTSQSVLDRETQSIRIVLAKLHSNLYFPAVRFFGWLLSKLWRVLFQGIDVDIVGIQSIHALIAQAKKEGCHFGMIYIPTHKTHLDYLIISYLCFAYGLPIPRIAAGDNMDLPIVGTFLRANGSFFMRRSWGNDVLYKCILSAYVHELVDDNNPLEVFLEGGRSRVGRVSQLKMGFLSLLHDYVRLPRNQEKPKTIWLVPISLDYDRILEVKEYANQRLGKKKQRESLYHLFRSVRNLFSTNCGRAYLRFGKSVALQAQDKVDNVADIIGCRLQQLCTVTSTSIIASILLWKRSSMSCDVLEAYIDWLIKELNLRHIPTTHLSDDLHKIWKPAVSILDLPIHGTKICFLPSGMPPSHILEIDYYRNQLAHHFVPQMAVFGAIHSFRANVRNGIWSTNTTAIHHVELLPTTQFLLRFLSQLVYHPNPKICIPEVETLLARLECVSILSIEASKVYSIDWSAWKRCRLVQFNLSFLWPLLDVMWVTVQAACECSEGKEMGYEEFIRKAQQLAENMLFKNEIIYAEALCKETIKQTVEWLTQLQILYYRNDRVQGPSVRAASPPPKTDRSASIMVKASEKAVDLLGVVNAFRYRPTTLSDTWVMSSHTGTHKIVPM